MDPLSSQSFSHDYVKFVYQNPDVRVINYGVIPKPFELGPSEKTKKSKKEPEKRKSENNEKPPETD